MYLALPFSFEFLITHGDSIGNEATSLRLFVKLALWRWLKTSWSFSTHSVQPT